MINTGEHLGIIIAPLAEFEEAKFRNVPIGWIAIPLEDLTEKLFEEAMNASSRGRKDWPENANINKLGTRND